MKGNASVRVSQILVGIVLAFTAIVLYRTSIDANEVRTANDTRALGTSIAQRESARVDQTLAAIQSLKNDIDAAGLAPATLIAQGRATIAAEPMIDVVDFFDANSQHLAHVDAQGRGRAGNPPRKRGPHVAAAVVRAIDLVLTDSGVTRMMAASRALRIPMPDAPPGTPGRIYVYVAQPLVRHLQVVATIVARIDVQRLVVDDVAARLPGRYVIDDGSGNIEAGARSALGRRANDAQSFQIPFADRRWTLTLAPSAPEATANPWLFGVLWLVAWSAVAVPIEVVGLISRRVQVLNAGLEAAVASRTQELQRTVAESRTLAAVVESVHEGVMLVDAGDVVRYANDALGRELGVAPHDLIGRRVGEYAPFALSTRQLGDLRDAVRSYGFAYLETERTRADGQRYWAGITLTSRGGDGGAAEELIAVSRDVSERRRLVDELVEAKAELERQMRVRADFIGTASHELRTPATTLRTLAALLDRKVLPRYPLSDEDAKIVGMFDFETRRLADLVDDLLEVAKVDATETPLAQEDMDLGAVVSGEIATTFSLDSKRKAQIRLTMPAEPAIVCADERAVRRIVVNLVGNALKFTPADGVVDVTVEPGAERARLAVADTGVGIPEADLPHVFERFYRVERPGTEIRGTGLGLAIVARLVERMRGSVSISSEIGRGTTVAVELPTSSAPSGNDTGEAHA